MKKISLVLATAALAVSGAAIAGPSYTYVDIGYVVAPGADEVRIDANGTSVVDTATTGYTLRGSFGFADIFHVGAGYADGEVGGGKGINTVAGIGTDTTAYNLYFGFNPAMTDNVDLVARIGYSFDEGKVAGSPNTGTVESTAAFLQAGTRAMVSEKFELNAFATYVDGETELKTSLITSTVKADYEDVTFSVGGVYYFTPMISAGVDVNVTGGTKLPSIEVGGVDYRIAAADTFANLFFRLNF